MENDDDFILPNMTEREISIRRRVHRLAEFYRHTVTYVIIIGLLWIINATIIYSTDQPSRWYAWWAIWPTMGWGIGLLTHGLTVLPFWSFFSQEWEDRKVREMLEQDKS